MVETLSESELFGHVRGAFTGAAETKAGLFEAADGGTLFLDEVGELPFSVQAKLLRVIENGEVQRVGSVDTRKVDVRLVAATNRDLRVEVESGRFRSDLYYRLNIAQINLPPLRDRREDIPYLTSAFVRAFSQRFSKLLTGVTTGAERLLIEAPWEGNVRQLRNVLERGCMLAEGEFVSERDLAGAFQAATARTASRPAPRRDADAAAAGDRARAHHQDARRGPRQQGSRGSSARHQQARVLPATGAPRPPPPHPERTTNGAG